MGAAEWIAGAGLIAVLFMCTGGVIWRLAENKVAILDRLDEHKEQIDDELTAIRISAYKEYQILRKEMVDTATVARREFGDSLIALREKVNQVELFIRDQLRDTRHSLQGAIDMRHQMLEDKLEKTEERLRELELESARRDGQSNG